MHVCAPRQCRDEMIESRSQRWPAGNSIGAGWKGWLSISSENLCSEAPALLPKQPSHLLSPRAPCPRPQVLALLLWAESFSVAQSAGPGHICQCSVLPAGTANSAAPATIVPLPSGCSSTGIRVQRALRRADGGVAWGDKWTWRGERVLGGLMRGSLGFWFRVVPGTGSS